MIVRQRIGKSAGHRYHVGQQYPIEYEEVPNGEYVDFRIKEAK